MVILKGVTFSSVRAALSLSSALAGGRVRELGCQPGEAGFARGEAFFQNDRFVETDSLKSPGSVDQARPGKIDEQPVPAEQLSVVSVVQFNPVDLERQREGLACTTSMRSSRPKSFSAEFTARYWMVQGNAKKPSNVYRIINTSSQNRTRRGEAHPVRRPPPNRRSKPLSIRP